MQTVHSIRETCETCENEKVRKGMGRSLRGGSFSRDQALWRRSGVAGGGRSAIGGQGCLQGLRRRELCRLLCSALEGGGVVLMGEGSSHEHGHVMVLL
jgi:hypothetical protein